MAKPAWIVEAEKHLSFHEGANNDTTFGAHYGLNHEPWCAMFVSWCCQKVGKPLPVMQAGMSDGFAGVYSGMQWAKANGYWRPSWDAKAGDAVVYGWAGPGSTPDNMHVGFIVDPGAGRGTTARTIEGNRGDQVERQSYTVGESVVLGTIAITEILRAPHNKKHKAAPQPRHPAHPHDTGPHQNTSGLNKQQRRWIHSLVRWFRHSNPKGQ